LPGSVEFMAAYQAALGGLRGPIGVSRTLHGTINALVVLYYASVEFTTLAPITRPTYRSVIERFRTEHGDKPVASLKQEHVRAIVRARAATPGAANKMLRTIKMLMRFAIQEGWRTGDPTFTVKKFASRPRTGSTAGPTTRSPLTKGGTPSAPWLGWPSIFCSGRRNAAAMLSRMGPQARRGAMAGAIKLVVSSESEQIAVKPPEGIVKP
jgi:hypothetical protein